MRIFLKYCLSYCSSRVLFSSFLIKANKKSDKNDENSENFTKYKSVQIFRVDERDRLVPNWHTIDGIFKKNRDVKIKPLKVLVVCGKHRIGKSTFCSLLYNNNNNNFNNNINELDINLKSNINEKQGEHPKVLEKILKIFETSSDEFKPQTNGIWITPIPVSVRDKRGHILCNVFIVDVEGILGPNSNKFSHQQLFVLALLMSSHFIYYLEHPFNEYHEEILRKYSTLAQKINTRKQKLILLITNLKNNRQFKYGSESSNKYLTTLEQEIKTNLKAIRQNFDSESELECYLMPEPSEKMRRNLLNDEDSYYSIEDVGEDYWKCLSGFREKYFEECDQTKNWKKNEGINGEKFVEYLRHIFEEVDSVKLEKIADGYRLLSDNTNTVKSDEAVVYYKEQMKEFFKEFISDKLNEEKLKLEHKKFFDISFEEFCREPYSDWLGTGDRDYKKELKTKLKLDFEDFLKNSKLYKQCLKDYTTKMIDFLRNTRLTTDTSDNRDIGAMHSKLKNQNISFFQKNYKNFGQSYDYKFEEKFTKKVDKLYEPIEANMTILKDMIRKHRDEIKKRFYERPWYKRFFNRSNTWIHADNDCMDMIYSEVSEKLSKHLKKYGFDFKDLFLDETGKIFEGKYRNTKEVENVVVVAGSTLAAFGGIMLTASTAGIAPIVGLPIYFVARLWYEPKMKRNEMKDQN